MVANCMLTDAVVIYALEWSIFPHVLLADVLKNTSWPKYPTINDNQQ